MDSLSAKSLMAELFLSLCILTTLVYNAVISVSTIYNFPLISREVLIQSIFIMCGCFLLIANTYYLGPTPALLFKVDEASLLAKMLLILSIIFSLFVGYGYTLKQRVNQFEFYSVVLLGVLSLFMLGNSQDLLSIYICLEMQSLSLYILASFKRNSAFSTEAGLKYFVLGAFISGLYLFGCTLIYGVYGSTNLHDLSLILSEVETLNVSSTPGLIGASFIIITFLFKLTVAPFHMWAPDVYEGAPFNSTVILVLGPKIIILLVLYRMLFYSLFPLFSSFKIIFAVAACLSLFVGSFYAFYQKRLKRLLVYSSISHLGFIMLATTTGTIMGIESSLYYLTFYIVNSILIWSVFSLIIKEDKAIYLTDLAGFSKLNFPMAITLAIGLFSLAGIPPLIGFNMKFLVLAASMSSSLYLISIIVILFSVVGAYYYLKIIKIMFFEPVKSSMLLGYSYRGTFFEDISCFSLSISLIIVLTFFFWPDIILLLVNKVGLSIVGS